MQIQRFSSLLVQLIVFALGEEIAWRAFFQKQFSKMFPYVPSLIISEALFLLGHLNSRSINCGDI